MNYYAFHIGDYAGATRHLSWDEDIAYRRMLDAYYTREAPLPADRRALYRLVGAGDKRQREAVDAVLAEFFTQDADGGWRNRRCDEEIAKAEERAVERAAKKDNENERQKRHRERRKVLFEQLREVGIVPPYDTATQSLEDMLASRTRNAPVTRDNPSPVTQTQRLTNPNPNPNPKEEDDDGKTRARDSTESFEDTEKALYAVPELNTQPVRVNAVIAPIWKLVQQGYDLQTQVIPSVRRQAITATRPIKSWAYFVDGIVQDAAPTVISKPFAGDRPHGFPRQNSAAQQLRDAIAEVKSSLADCDPAA
jgi:uncharacterized protein YdaU (DUF1376 family)